MQNGYSRSVVVDRGGGEYPKENEYSKGRYGGVNTVYKPNNTYGSSNKNTVANLEKILNAGKGEKGKKNVNYQKETQKSKEVDKIFDKQSENEDKTRESESNGDAMSDSNISNNSSVGKNSNISKFSKSNKISTPKVNNQKVLPLMQQIREKPPPVLENENPLEYSYTFWFSQRGRGAKNKTNATDFENNIKYITSVSSVEQFWKVYSHLIKPHELNGRCDIHIFKFGIRPMWEDEANKNGGKWIVRLRKGVATRCWENLILAIVGEQFTCGNEICGAVVSVRYHTEDIVGIWNRTSTNLAVISQIRDTATRVLNLPSSTIMEYKEHYESIKDASTRYSHNNFNNSTNTSGLDRSINSTSSYQERNRFEKTDRERWDRDRHSRFSVRDGK